MPNNFAAYVAKSNSGMTEDELEQIVAILDRRHRKLVAEGKIDNLDQRMAEIASDEIKRLRSTALLEKKRATLMIQARDRGTALIAALRDEGLSPEKAVLALFEGTSQGIRQGWHSVDATRLAFEARYVGDMTTEVLREVPESLKLTQNPAFAEDIVREMFEIRDGGEPGRSGNPDARKVARILSHHAEASRCDLNGLGAAIDALDGWGGPHAHDVVKMLRVSPGAWVQWISARLDLSRTFPDAAAENTIYFLTRLYAAITTGKRNRPAIPSGADGPRDLSRLQSLYPVLFFRTADDWLAYQGEFGRGNIWTGMLAHQRKMAAIAAEMQLLGPEPEATIHSLRASGSEIQQGTQEASGLAVAAIPIGFTVDKLLAGQRATQSMTKLGGAMVGSVSTLVTHAANLQYQGRSFFAAYHDQLIDAIKGVARAYGSDAGEIAYLLGEGMDGMLDSLHFSVFAQDSRPGAMSGAMTKFFRWSGSTARSDGIRAAGARIVAAQLGSMAVRVWEDVPEPLRLALERHGLAAERWEEIQRAAFDGPTGNRYVTSDRAAPAIQAALRRFYAEEIDLSLTGQETGTVVGKLLRTLARFKVSPIGHPKGEVPPHIGHLLAGMILVGYVAVTAKRYRSGYHRQKFVNSDGSTNRDTMLTAFVQGGGAGIYADYLFGQVCRFEPDTSGDHTETFLLAREGDINAGDRLNVILERTRFANLSYIRPSLDFLILREIWEWISPGFFKRQRLSQSPDRTQSLLNPKPVGSPLTLLS